MLKPVPHKDLSKVVANIIAAHAGVLNLECSRGDYKTKDLDTFRVSVVESFDELLFILKNYDLILDYSVVCDDTNNPSAALQTDRVYAHVNWKYKRAVDLSLLMFELNSNGWKIIEGSDYPQNWQVMSNQPIDDSAEELNPDEPPKRAITHEQMTGGWYRLWDIEKTEFFYACYEHGWIVYYGHDGKDMRRISLKTWQPHFVPAYYDRQVGIADPIATEEDKAQKVLLEAFYEKLYGNKG